MWDNAIDKQVTIAGIDIDYKVANPSNVHFLLATRKLTFQITLFDAIESFVPVVGVKLQGFFYCVYSFLPVLVRVTL